VTILSFIHIAKRGRLVAREASDASAPDQEEAMLTRRLPLATLATFAALLPTAAMAHTGVGATGGFAHGFWHPITGLDHVLAMVLVGVLAWQLGARAVWLVPATFVLVMAAGGVLAVAGMALPLVELGIALSVVVLGAAVAFGIRAPVAVAMGIAGLFAIFHGHAHGAEMPVDAGGLAYGIGFMIATALLHLGGLGLGYLVGAAGDRYGVVVRSAGGLAALAGIAILSGAL
jgi:urease accessory protein